MSSFQSNLEINLAVGHTMEIIKPKFLPKIDTTQNIKIQNDGDTPIFKIHKLLLRIPEIYKGEVMHLTVSKNWLLCILAGPPQITLLRFFLPRAIPPGEVPLEKHLAGYKISKLFVDHTGHHVLISSIPESRGLSADFLYIHGNGKVRRVEKFKEHEITAVAFNSWAGTENNTGPILLGTSVGIIFETELAPDAERSTQRRQLYDLGLGAKKYPIFGLELLRMPNSQKYVVLANTADCIFTFHETLKHEDRSLQNIFAAYVSGIRMPGIIKVKTELKYSILRFYAPPKELYPTKFVWLCGTGLRTGSVLNDANKLDAQGVSSHAESGLLVTECCISLDFEQRKHLSYEERRQNVPIDLVMTEYHALILYSEQVKAICLLNEQLNYQEQFAQQRTGKLLSIVRDYLTGSIYMYTTKNVYQWRINDEQRNIWEIHLERGNFEQALVLVADNESQLDKVRAKKAETAFAAGLYEQAGIIYAETSMPFEQICLKFMALENKRPIMLYVRECLKQETNEEQIKVLVVWLTDLYLTQINMQHKEDLKQKQEWQREFDEFMQGSKVKQCLRKNRIIIQQLIAAHADAHNLSQFAIANEDYAEVIRQQLIGGKYKQALDTLKNQRNMQLYYKYAPILIEKLPSETVELLMQQGRKLNLDQLIPALIAIESPQHIEQIMKYLEHAIYNLCETNQAAHNYLLRLYAEHKPQKVMKYLANEGADVSLVHYDIPYAISVCRQFDACKGALVLLQRLSEMWVAAVDLALTFDLQLAKDTATAPHDEELQRKLWLRIAEHEIKSKNNVKSALELLQECQLLRIEDILPYFHDFQQIDDFKEPICKALKEYNQSIQELQNEMEECTKQSERVCGDLQGVRERFIRIAANECCTICENYLLIKPFFLFACGHKFHNDCLEKQVLPLLTSEKSRRLTVLKHQFETLITQAIASGDNSLIQMKKRDNIRLEIEEILAADCLYCGLMIDSIDQPFIDDWDQVNIDWA